MKKTSKKIQLEDSVALFPDDSRTYSSSQGDLIDACITHCAHYSDFTAFVFKRLGKHLPRTSATFEYRTLALEKGYIDFSKSVKDALVYLPKGVVVRDAIHAYVSTLMQSKGFTQLRLPYLFGKDGEDVSALVSKFGERVMGVSTSDSLFLRYASDPVLFSYLRDKCIPETYNPLRIYSPGDTFRNEKAGEVDRLKRPRVSFIEDYHIFTSDALKEIEMAHTLNSKVMDEFCDDWFISCDIEHEFFKENQKFFQHISALCNKPILFNVLKQSSNYYALQLQYFCAISNGTFINYADVQLDIVNGKRFNIHIKDKGCVTIVHGNTTGRMEKLFVVLFDRIIKMKASNKKPRLPTWISPVQVRILPVQNTLLAHCRDIGGQFKHGGVRVDIDDTECELGQKIQRAEKEWIPYIVIIGEKEIKSKIITVRYRDGEQVCTTMSIFLHELEVELREYPKSPQGVPLLVSEYIDFDSF